MSCHSLLQGIFLIQGSNLGLLHCRPILYHLGLQGSPSSLCCHSLKRPVAFGRSGPEPCYLLRIQRAGTGRLACCPVRTRAAVEGGCLQPGLPWAGDCVVPRVSMGQPGAAQLLTPKCSAGLAPQSAGRGRGQQSQRPPVRLGPMSLYASESRASFSFSIYQLFLLFFEFLFILVAPCSLQDLSSPSRD